MLDVWKFVVLTFLNQVDPMYAFDVVDSTV